MRTTALAIGLLLGVYLLCGTAAFAQAGNTRTTVFVGTSQYSDGKAKTVGTTIGVGWGVTLSENVLLSLSGASTETTGKYEENGQTYPISASTISGRTGVTHFFRTGRDAMFIPFYGAGLSVASYVIDYTYPDSEIGTTSGTAPGVFGSLGVEMRMGRHVTFIPQYQVNAHNIKTEAGDSIFLRSAGLLISLRISS